MTEQATGFLLIDKPEGWTSFDVVAKLRGITGIRKIGHAGTLDPFATGLLLVAVGRAATKQIDQFVKQDKVYEATLKLGYRSSTHDPEGEIVVNDDGGKYDSWPTQEHITRALEHYTGLQQQIPPKHAAIKVNGKKLYELAREGKTVERKPREIVIHSIEQLRYESPELDLRIHCGSGTYIRALARDLGEHWSVGAYCLRLRRTKIGAFDIADAQTMEDLAPENWQTFLINP